MFFLFIGAVAVAIALVICGFRLSKPLTPVTWMYCTNCGTAGFPQFQRSGSTFVEVLLWLFVLVPGVIYSIWRASTKRWVCPKCGLPGMIPLDSPRAQRAIGPVTRS